MVVVAPAAFAGGGGTCQFGSCDQTTTNTNSNSFNTWDPTSITKDNGNTASSGNSASQTGGNVALTIQKNQSNGNEASYEGGNGGNVGAGGSGGSIDKTSNQSVPTCIVITLCKSSVNGTATSNDNSVSGSGNSSADGGPTDDTKAVSADGDSGSNYTGGNKNVQNTGANDTNPSSGDAAS